MRTPQKPNQAAIDGYVGGLSLTDAGRIAGVSWHTLWRWLIAAGVPVRGKKSYATMRSTLDFDEVKSMYWDEGMTCDQIASALMVSSRVVRSFIATNSLKRPKIKFDESEVRSMYLGELLSMRDISELLKCTISQLEYFMSNKGIHRITPGPSTKISKKPKRACGHVELEGLGFGADHITSRYSCRSGYVVARLKKNSIYNKMARCEGSYSILEHRLVAAIHAGRMLEKWEIVHHKNHIRDDNSPGNLEVISRSVEHNAETVSHEHLLKMKSENECLKEMVSNLREEIRSLRCVLSVYDKRCVSE